MKLIAAGSFLVMIDVNEKLGQSKNKPPPAYDSKVIFGNDASKTVEEPEYPTALSVISGKSIEIPAPPPMDSTKVNSASRSADTSFVLFGRFAVSKNSGKLPFN